MLDWLLPLIRRFEGLHKLSGGLIYPYLCPAGKPTQGWGVLVATLDVPAITPEQADEQLIAIAPGYVELAIQLSPNLRMASPKIQAAIGDFVYNLGPGRYKASTLRRKVEAEDWQGASEELLKWVRGGGRVLPGLVARRKEEARLLLDGANERLSSVL